ncbi:MAG: PAS domain S-box protein, partial [Gemmatimonadales bacterium]|nr:PAS domain S-box protein [Gemmatimonadales bacterium]NIP07945.1 PAS domain S-box protein [Gemmatimonadales bacterium]
EIDGITGVVTDITDRKRAEEALRESEGKFRTLAETIAAAAFIYQGTRLRYVNPAAQTITGCTREELLAMDFWDVIHPDFREEAKERGLAHQRGEPVPTRYEAKLLTKNGEERWLDLTVGVVEFEGKPAVMGTGFDITERKRTEDALRRSEERYRLLADNATDVIWARDLSLKPTYVSPSITRLRGSTVEEAMTQSLDEVLTPASLQLARKTLAEELANESAEDKDLSRSRTLELEMYRNNGSTIWTEMTVNFLRDEENRPVGLLGVTRDISERKRAEEALQESEAKFRTLAETVAAAAFIYQGEQIRYVNSAAEALTGYTREELLQMNFWDVIAPDFRELVRERGLARQMGQDVPLRYEVKLVTKDGDERWVDFTAGKVEFDGKPAVLGTAFDVTERKQAEETIKHLAYHDALTDLPNRTLFKDRLT